MRDIFVTAVVFGSLPFILRRPWIGIIMWCWLSYMNPHKQAWGFATTMPFAMLVALATLLGILWLKEPKRISWTRESITLAMFMGWMLLTTFFALNPEGAWPQLDKVIKIQLMTFVTLMLITNEQRLRALVWIIVLSLAYYGVKGGIFTIAHGGQYRVWGPTGTFIGGNNELALALIMVIPLVRFLQLDCKQAWMRTGLGIMMGLMVIAAIGSQSRGAFVAMGAMGLFLWLKSRKKIATGVMVVVTGLAALSIMPPEYFARMETINSYQEDGSAMGRINAWWFAWNVAKDRPLIGGGFETFAPWLFPIYAPNPDQYHDVHSIYFEVLGEHGFVGFGLFIILGFFTWRKATRIKQQSKAVPELKWIGDLASMVQVSFIGYGVGGAFLGLAYFDLPYHMVAMVAIASAFVDREVNKKVVAASEHLSASLSVSSEACEDPTRGRRMTAQAIGQSAWT